MKTPATKFQHGICWYCGKRCRLNSDEHVVPRALGGGLVIRICEPCNHRANKRIDDALIRLPEIARERAQLGLRDRGDRPFVHSQTLETIDGLRIQATWTQDGIDARILPTAIPLSDDGFFTELIVDARDADEHRRKQAERAAKQGMRIGPAVPHDERSGFPPGRFREGENVLLVAVDRDRSRPAWLWPATVAKIALGCLCDGAQHGYWPGRIANDLVIHALRMLAFDRRYSPDLWEPEEIRTAPDRALATDPVAMNVRPSDHLVAVHGRNELGEAPAIQVVLFGRWQTALRLPGLRISSSHAWLFSAPSGNVRRGTPAEIANFLLEQRRLERQPTLF